MAWFLVLGSVRVEEDATIRFTCSRMVLTGSLAEGDAMLPLPLSPPWALQLQSRPLYPRDQVQERTGTLLSETGGGGDTMGETLAWGLGRKGVLDAEDWVLGEERVTCIMWCF